MKKQGKYTIIALALFLLSPDVHAHAQQTGRLPPDPPIPPHLYARQTFKISSIPSPLIARREAGKSLPQLERLEQLLKKEKFVEFYDELFKIFETTRNGMKKAGKTWVDLTREERVAMEWIFYYCLTAPLLSNEEIEEGEMRVFWYIKDFSVKLYTCEWFYSEKTKEIAELFGIDEKRLLTDRIETITATLIFLNKVYLYTKDEKMHDREDALLWKKYGDEEKKYLETTARPHFGQTTPEGFDIDTKLANRERRRSRMKKIISSMRYSTMDRYIRKLVLCFPKQGRVVQEYVKKTGFHISVLREYIEEARQVPIEYDMAILLRHAIERTPETEWLFKGLPSRERIDAMRQKMTKDSNASAARALEENKRSEKKQAEELVRKQTEKVRREAEAARRAAAQVNLANPPSPQ